MGVDPRSFYANQTSSIPTNFTDILLSLGFSPTPFANEMDTFGEQNKFMQILKNVLDRQIGGGFQNNPQNAPYNLRNLFHVAGNAFNDPMDAPVGTQDFFSGGWKAGAIPTNRSLRHEGRWQALNNYPNVPPPGGGASGNTGGGAAANNQLVGSYTVALPGGGSMTVNANNPQAAIENAQQQSPQYNWAGFNPNVAHGGYQF